METRRRFLGALSLGLTGLAGCLSESDGPGGDSGTDAPTTDEATTDGPGSIDDATTDDPRSTDDATTDETEVSVTNPVVRKAVTHYSWPASTKILAPEDQQFVVATVAGPEETTPPDFTLEAGGDEFSAGLDATGRYDAHLAGREGGSVLQNEHAEGYLAFRVPSPLATDEARIVRDDDGPATPLPAEEVAVLGRRAPDFELDALELPDSVESPEQVDVSLAVTNVGDVDGRFLAGVNWPTDGIADDDETTVLERRVAAGETTSFSLSLETTYAATETSEHPLTVEGCVSASRSVEVIVDETTTPDQRYH